MIPALVNVQAAHLLESFFTKTAHIGFLYPLVFYAHFLERIRYWILYFYNFCASCACLVWFAYANSFVEHVTHTIRWRHLVLLTPSQLGQNNLLRQRRLVPVVPSLLAIATSCGRHLPWLNGEIETWMRGPNSERLICLTDAEMAVEPRLRAYQVLIDRSDLAASLKKVAAYLDKVELDKENKGLLGWLALAAILFALFGKEK